MSRKKPEGLRAEQIEQLQADVIFRGWVLALTNTTTSDDAMRVLRQWRRHYEARP